MKFLESLDDNFGGIVAILVVLLLIALLSYHCGGAMDEDLAERYNDGYDKGVEEGYEKGYDDAWMSATEELRDYYIASALEILERYEVTNPDLICEIESMDY